MTIEFNTPRGRLKEWIMTYLMNSLMDMHDKYEFLIRAQVDLREEPGKEKSCNIELTFLADSVFAHHRADSFEEACLHAVATIKQRLNEIVSNANKGKFEKPDSLEIKKSA